MQITSLVLSVLTFLVQVAILTVMLKKKRKEDQMDNSNKYLENKKKYDLQYAKENIKQIRFVLNKKSDKEIIDHLDKQENKNAYIKNLILKDMQK